MAKLARLAVSARRRAVGAHVGERRSPRRGNSQEFADHRPYVPGDDLRFLDWHLYGRLDALWVKLFEEEQDRVVQVLIDCSASMEGEKLDQARRVAAALAYVGLCRQDRVAVGAIDDRLRRYDPPRRGRESTAAVLRTLETLELGGGTDLARAIDGWPRQRGASVALLFTDFLHPDGAEPVLRRLLARGAEVHVFHVVAPAELRPPIDGDLVVVDRETGEELAVSLDDAALDRYARVVQAWLADVEATARRLGCGYVRLPTDAPVDELVLGDLRRLGLVT